MPEGPEVRRMAMGLAERIEGKVLEEAEVLGGKWIKTPPTGISEFQQSLPTRVQRVDVKGKTIQIYLENGWTIWNTLGMSGGWKDHRTKHSHFRISTQGGREVWFDDVRRFGNLIFIKSADEVRTRLAAVGPDMLGEAVSLELFTSRIGGRRIPIAKAIMDQKVISGVGNYIKCEVLYRARISPHRICTEISPDEMKALYEATRWVIRKSFEQGGATLATYTDMDGHKGEFPFFFHVYRKEVCPAGHRVIREETADKRTTHWVPEVQG